MEGILDWGVVVIVWLQQRFSPELDVAFKIITWMGNEGFYLILLPFVYWCVDRAQGARLAILLLLSTYLNAIAKVLAHQPRPFQYDPAVKMIAKASGGGFPSGHTQGTVVVWGCLINRFPRRWVWAVGIFMMVFVPLSRIYLGVHFPTDLLGGYVIGGIILFLWLWVEPMVGKWLAGKTLLWQLGFAVGGPLVLIVMFVARDAYILSATGALMGLGVGIVLERKWLGFEAGGPSWIRALRFLLGIAMLIAIQGGLKYAFSLLGADPLFRFSRHLVAGLWISFASPWIFLKLRLVGKGTDPR